MWFEACTSKGKRKESREDVKSAVVTAGWWKKRKKERTEGKMSGIFVGVFEILKKERNESKKIERTKKLRDL